MDFLKCIDSIGDRARVGRTWWEELVEESETRTSPEGASALRLNVERTRLFELNHRHSTHVAVFCEALERAAVGPSVDRAKWSINSAFVAGATIMISAGPPAAPIGAGACALIEFRSFLAYYLRRGSRGPRTPGGATDFDPDVWEALDDPVYYDAMVNPTVAYRSALPNRFWAALDDVKGLADHETVNSGRLRNFLGLVDNLKPCILIRIRDRREPAFFIPTGWDGFDNGHFLENGTYHPGEADGHYGFTKDLQAAHPNTRGAREVVAAPVPTTDTQLVRKYQ